MSYKRTEPSPYQPPWDHKCQKGLANQGNLHRRHTLCGKPAAYFPVVKRALCREHAGFFFKRAEQQLQEAHDILKVKAKRPRPGAN